MRVFGLLESYKNHRNTENIETFSTVLYFATRKIGEN